MTLRNNVECDGCGAVVAIDASHGWQQLWPTINGDHREHLHYCPGCVKARIEGFAPADRHARGVMRRFVDYVGKVLTNADLDDYVKVCALTAALVDLRAGDDFLGRPRSQSRCGND